MGKGKQLLENEKGQINALKNLGWSNRRISQEIGRSHYVIDHFVSAGDAYRTLKSPGRPKKLKIRQKRAIMSVVSNSCKGTRALRDEFAPEVLPYLRNQPIINSEIPET